jgi:NAD(P)-dependent dehydrogenase (short-subunit alcohol dehydrogenase family)
VDTQPEAEVKFDGQVVIVTGAGNGLGRAYARELARRGALVVVNDFGGATDGSGGSRRAADFVVEEIMALGGSAVASFDSVREEEGCRHIAALALEAGGRIDAVVHNAGILRNTRFDGMSDDHWFPVVETHLLGGFFLSRAVWPTMVAAGYGRMVFTSSASGLWGRVEGANYGAAKAGLIGLCNVLALEGVEHGILANAILPVGSTRLGGAPDASDSSPEAETVRAQARADRMAPEWVAPMVVYLASNRCDRTHRYYSAIRGRYAEVFVGVSGGWVAPALAPPSVEDVVSHLDMIEDRSSYSVPRDTFDEVAIASRAVDASPGNPGLRPDNLVVDHLNETQGADD